MEHPAIEHREFVGLATPLSHCDTPFSGRVLSSGDTATHHHAHARHGLQGGFGLLQLKPDQSMI